MKTLTTLEELYAAATPGEWKLQPWDDGLGGTVHVGENGNGFIDFNDIVLEADCDDYSKSVIPDLRLICETHNALPALIAAARALEAIRARISGEFDHPTLIALGPLHEDRLADVARLAATALEALDNQPLSQHNEGV